MPTYEYVCKNCGDGFEVTQAFTDTPLTTCEECGGPLRKVYGSIGIVFKGGGFYRTENRREHTSSSGGSGSLTSTAVTNVSESSPSSKKDTPAGSSAGSGSTGETKTAPSKSSPKP